MMAARATCARPDCPLCAPDTPGAVLATVRPILRAQQQIASGRVACAAGCGATLPAISDDVSDPVVVAYGRQCDACYQREQRTCDSAAEAA